VLVFVAETEAVNDDEDTVRLACLARRRRRRHRRETGESLPPLADGADETVEGLEFFQRVRKNAQVHGLSVALLAGGAAGAMAAMKQERPRDYCLASCSSSGRCRSQRYPRQDPPGPTTSVLVLLIIAISVSVTISVTGSSRCRCRTYTV
jgi:hypothetical protein